CRDAIQNSPPTTTTEEPIHAIETYVDGEAITFDIDAEPCLKSHYLLIYVHSDPGNAERRRVIRTTWASNEILKLHGAKLIFVTGQVETLDMQASLDFESQLHKDILEGCPGLLEMVLRDVLKMAYSPLALVFPALQGCKVLAYMAVPLSCCPESPIRQGSLQPLWCVGALIRLQLVVIDYFFFSMAIQLYSEVDVGQRLLYNKRAFIQANFTDTYRNLTYKAISGLRWAQENCPNTTYVLKTDDDIVVDIHRVVRLMKAYIENKWGKKNILAGYIWPHMNVDRNKSSKWYVSPEEFPKPFYLKYCSGSSYLMSTDVVAKFYTNSLTVPFFWIDDYYVTGMLASAAGVTPTSLNDRYILENNADMAALLQNDSKTRFVFVHSPDTITSNFVWKTFLERWG
ncbi:uncharacterized protein LOC127878596, partial [Dreissena polymorpha]|uniref:uncharacterized protein LOC127878596 n=1 Tax=Dreissena polymorpha TaxID=45954 RepID=UPI002264CD51